MKRVKFCVFSDYHYWKTHYPNRIELIGNIVEAAHAEHADFMIQCGDLCHNAPTAPELDLYLHNKYGIPAFNCLGNHEMEDADSLYSVCQVYGMKKSYEYYDIKGFRIIVLDTNYYIDVNGALVHQPPYTHSCSNGDRIGAAQLAWLEQAIESAQGSCLIFSHATFENDFGSPDAAQVRSVIAEANHRMPGKVLICCNGHYHTNSINVADNVVYFDVNAAFNVFWSPKENPLLPDEFKKSARMAGNCCFTKNPLFAIVTVEESGHIVINGRESAYLFDVSPEAAGLAYLNKMGRCAEPRISDAELNLDIFGLGTDNASYAANAANMK